MEIAMIRMEVSRLRSFGQLVEFEASRSVDLIKAIDDTIYAVCKLRDQADTLAGEAAELIQSIKRAEGSIDADGEILRLLEHGRDALHTSYESLLRKKDAASRAPELKSEDGLVEAYEVLLDSVSAAHNIVNELCWTLGEHEAELDEVMDGEYSSAEDLIKALRG
ncbi:MULTISPECIES: hypothetical protein [Burkholderia cepacia complex]|nr:MULTISPECIES: hypothetical protein [Burkholderia cepacia complex]